MALDYSLRPAAKDELAELYAVHRAAMETYVAQTWGRWDDPWQREHFETHWPDVRLAIEVSGELAGFLDLDEQGPSIYVGNIELKPEVQRRGIGTAILKRLLDYVDQFAPKKTYVHLFTDPDTAGFYRPFGFRGPEQSFYGMSVKKFDKPLGNKKRGPVSGKPLRPNGRSPGRRAGSP